MKAKNVIKGLVPWADARHTLATRLRRKLAEDGVRAHIASADPSIQRGHALELLQQWYLKSSAVGDACMPSMHDGALERSLSAVAEGSPLQQAGRGASGGSAVSDKPGEDESASEGARLRVLIISLLLRGSTMPVHSRPQPPPLNRTGFSVTTAMLGVLRSSDGYRL